MGRDIAFIVETRTSVSFAAQDLGTAPFPACVRLSLLGKPPFEAPLYTINRAGEVFEALIAIASVRAPELPQDLSPTARAEIDATFDDHYGPPGWLWLTELERFDARSFVADEEDGPISPSAVAVLDDLRAMMRRAGAPEATRLVFAFF